MAHAAHFHRWLPALVLPFFLIASPHIGHRRALLDFDRMPPCNREASRGTRFNEPLH